MYFNVRDGKMSDGSIKSGEGGGRSEKVNWVKVLGESEAATGNRGSEGWVQKVAENTRGGKGVKKVSDIFLLLTQPLLHALYIIVQRSLVRRSKLPRKWA